MWRTEFCCHVMFAVSRVDDKVSGISEQLWRAVSGLMRVWYLGCWVEMLDALGVVQGSVGGLISRDERL